MSRLSREFRRLFLSSTAAPLAGDGDMPGVGDAQGRDRGLVRGLVLELARPAQWQALSAVWQGVQAELDLPAPAIAVNGVDGLQLWFSLLEPLDMAQAQAFLQGLRLRYLPEVPRDRVGLLPRAADGTQVAMRLPTVPAAQVDADCWSAFVAPDLAPIFEDTPWLDVQPGEEGQADLLSRLQSITPAQLQLALQRLQAAAAPAMGSAPGPGAGPEAGAQFHATERPTHTAADRAAQAAGNPDAQRFLLSVMNDTAAPLDARIKAAKALLPYRPAD